MPISSEEVLPKNYYMEKCNLIYQLMGKFFRLKFAYRQPNDNGGVEKVKTEMFVECETYTEAEKMAYSVIEKEKFSNYEECEYEIVKTKFKSSDFIDNKTLQIDKSNESINGLIEHYFSTESDGFYIIKMKLITIDERTGKEKKSPLVCIVSEKSIHNAAATARDYMSKGLVDFEIVGTQLDPAEAIYLTPSSRKDILERYEA